MKGDTKSLVEAFDSISDSSISSYQPIKKEPEAEQMSLLIQ